MERVIKALAYSVFSRKAVVPCVGRWWKCLPMIRQVLLGCALHRLWPSAAPKKVKSRLGQPAVQIDPDLVEQDGLPGVCADGNDNWHAMHSFRVQKSFDFFNRPDIVTSLIIALRSQAPAHHLIAWMMKHLSVETESQRLEKLQIFVSPVQSPVYAAAAHGWELMSETRHWQAALAFNSLPLSAFFCAIWKALLPALAVLHVRVVGLIQSWPLRLVLTLLDDTDARDAEQIRQEFADAKRCCVPAGLHVLQDQSGKPHFAELLKEFVVQIDVSNFCRELSHAHMKMALSGGWLIW